MLALKNASLFPKNVSLYQPHSRPLSCRVCGLSYSLYLHSKSLIDWIAHTNVVLYRVESVRSKIGEMRMMHRPGETGGSHEQLEKSLIEEIGNLAMLSGDNEEQSDRALSLFTAVRNRIALSHKLPIEATALYTADTRIDSLTGEFITTENNYLKQRTAALDHFRLERFIITIASYAVLGIFLFLSLWQIYKTFNRRIAAEKVARDNEDKYKLLVESSQFTTGILSTEGVLRFASGNVEQLTGFRADEVVGIPTGLPIPTAEEWERDPARAGAERDVEVVTKSGEKRIISYRFSPLRDEQGRINEWQTVGIDVTRERTMERELERLDKDRENQQLLMQEIIDNIPSIVYIKDLEGRYIVVNKKLCEVLGRPASEDCRQAEMPSCMPTKNKWATSTPMSR